MTALADLPTRAAVAVDFDSTLFRLLDAVNLLPGCEHISYDTVRSYGGFAELCGGVDRMMAVIDQAGSFEGMVRLGDEVLFEHAAAALRRVAGRGTQIHILTDRPDARMLCVEKVLRLHEVPFASLNQVRAADKTTWCVERDVRVMVDDHPETLCAAAEAGLTGMTLAHHYVLDEAQRLGFAAHASWTELGPVLDRALDARYELRGGLPRQQPTPIGATGQWPVR